MSNHYKHADCDKAIIEERLDDACEDCRNHMIKQPTPPDQPEDAALLEQLMHLQVKTYQNGREWHVELGTLISYGDNWERIMQLIAEAKQGRHTLIVKRYKKLTAGMFGVKFYLDQPYRDDPRWTPWTRFILPRLKALEAAITKGEDLGDLAAMVETQATQPPAADTTKQGEEE